MEALGLPPLDTLRISHSNSNFSKQRLTHYGTTSEQSSPQLRPFHRTHHFQCGAIRMIADSEVYELKQMKDMSAARKRWEALVRKENVKVFTPREAGYAIQLSKKTLPDVRPSTEQKKAWVKGSTWIPVFDVDDSMDAGTISRKFSSFVMGACELLYNAGYRNLFWVQGDLEAAEDEDLVTEGPEPLKFAGLGGFSKFLGLEFSSLPMPCFLVLSMIAVKVQNVALQTSIRSYLERKDFHLAHHVQIEMLWWFKPLSK